MQFVYFHHSDWFSTLKEEYDRIPTWSKFPSAGAEQSWQYGCEHWEIIIGEKSCGNKSKQALWIYFFSRREQIWADTFSACLSFKYLWAVTVQKLQSFFVYKFPSQNLYELRTVNNTQWPVCRKCDQPHPCGFLGRLRINVMQGDSIDRGLRRNSLLTASRKSAGITLCPWNSCEKTTLLGMHGSSISTIILPFKILFQYRLVNTDLVTPTNPHTLSLTQNNIDPELSTRTGPKSEQETDLCSCQSN